MRHLDRLALTISAAGALLAACGGSQQPIGTPGAMPQVSAPAARANNKKYRVVYSFGASPDGYRPVASLIDVGGTLYGTTSDGGVYCNSYPGCGTVFSLTTGGTEKVLHSFSGSDGSGPRAGLIDVNSTLYGTTQYGGATADGTVFSITTDGTETVLHSFSGHDGAQPVAGLINVGDTLYGTTVYGGSRGKGTVFKISTAGAEKVVHSFGGGSPGGKFPFAGLIDVQGTLYGTTALAGVLDNGTVFTIKRGRQKTLYTFHGGDGSRPFASLFELNGTLYGTTRRGGSYPCYSYDGCGTVFSITPSGTEQVLHSFGSGTDGRRPNASLIEVKGTLYGTTLGGGKYERGTIFSITPSGTERVLHSFGNGADGNQPDASLIAVNGTLYGTTAFGGASKCYSDLGCGTVFALTP